VEKTVRVLIFSILTTSCFGAAVDMSRQPRVIPFEARGGVYVSRGAEYTVSVTPTREVLSAAGHAVSMSAVHADSKATLEPLARMPGKANYFIGSDVHTSYDLYGRVRWRNVYPGIDVIFRANQERFEYDFEIAPQRDASRIRLAFAGLDGVSVEENGDLVLIAGPLHIRQPRPIAYQVVSGKRRLVDVAYSIDASNHVRFRTATYDHDLPLVIDPEIVFQNSFGGSGQTTALGFARDSQGNLYVTGGTNSTDFGVTHAFQQQLGSAPLLVTGNAGGSWSFPTLAAATSVSSIVAAPSASSTLYAATPVGVFRSTNAGISWAITPNTGLSAQVITLAVDSGSATTVYAGTAQGLYVSTDGAITWQADTNGITGQGIATVVASPTQSGTVFASVQNPPALFRSVDFGQTWGMLTLPIQLQGPVNAVVFTSSGAIVAATFQVILISNDGGNTWTPGANQPVAGGQGLAISLNTNTLYVFNGVTSRIERSTDGGQTFSPVLPNVQLPFPTLIAVDPNNPSNVYIAGYNLFYRSADSGQTWSQLSLPYPINPQTIFVSPADSRLFLGAFTQNNAFVTKWSPDGSQVLYSTYLGGSGNDQANGIAVDGLGDAYITGYTTSSNFPTTNGAIVSKLTTTQDVFVAKLSTDGSQLLYSTLLGSQSATPTAIAVDLNGSAVVTGRAGLSFPVTVGSIQASPSTGCLVAFPFAGFTATGSAFVSRLMSNGDGFIFSTIFGGSCVTYANNVAIDGGGNAVVVGSTTSPDFPVTTDAIQPKLGGGYYDGFFSRFSPTGHLDYSTFIGGPGYDSINAVAFDLPGNIYLTGESGGLNVPPRTGFQPQVNASCAASLSVAPAVFQPQGNGIILKLDPTVQIIEGLTYLGAPGCLSPSSIAVDSNLNVWIAGNLNNPNPTPPTMSPVQFGGAGFVSKFSSDLTQLLFSTDFDSVAGLALDTSGFAYVGGSRLSATQTAYVAKIDPTPPASISIDSIASVDPKVNPNTVIGIAPGEVILIDGSNMGPASATAGLIQSGFLTTNVAGVQVTFDGVAVPLLSVSAQQIELVAPFELAGKSQTSIQVQYNGSQSNPVQIAVNPLDVQVLGVFNGDFTPNSQTNPAQPNSTMVMYIAGLGNTNPPSKDGQINGLPPAVTPTPIQVEWMVTGQEPTFLPVSFSGAAYGLAAGIYQINFVAPPQTVQPPLELLMGNNFVANFNVFVSQPPSGN
jgi:uncharacterized protein (TIGR03437 family)